MNQRLSDAAIKALSAAGFPTRSGLCQMFTRLVVEAVYGRRFDSIIHKGSAREAAEAFERDGRFVVPLAHGSVVGDLLYKKRGSNGFGHVGIRVVGNRVVENSSAHIDGPADVDARGLRTIIEFGQPDVIVRLPDKGAI